MAALAQLVEHWIVIPGVTGSIPVCRPKFEAKSPDSSGLFAFLAGRAGAYLRSDPIPGHGLKIQANQMVAA